MMRLTTTTPRAKYKVQKPAPTPAEVLAKERAKAAREGLELALLQQLTALGLTDGMVRQFAPIPGRLFRVDFAWPEHRLLLEGDGGTWDGGAHGRGTGIEKDNEKLALCTLERYYTIKATTSQVRSRLAALWVEKFLDGEEP